MVKPQKDAAEIQKTAAELYFGHCSSRLLAYPANTGPTLCDGIDIGKHSALGKGFLPFHLLRQA